MTGGPIWAKITHVTKEELLKVGQVMDRHGFSRKQLRYWDEIGLVPPRYIGTHRAYGERELERLHTVKALMGAGYSPKQLQGIFKASDVLPVRVLNEDQVYRNLLTQAMKGEVEIDVGTDFQRYNTAFKRLKRLAQDMGLTVFPVKTGEVVKVRARRKRSA